MPRVEPVNESNTPEKSAELLEGVNQKIGMKPNIFKTMAHSPAVLSAYLGLSGALAGTSISAGLREQIALTCAGVNSCGYCGAAHTAIGKGAGLDESEIKLNLTAQSGDTKVQAALDFTKKVLDTKANVTDADVQALRDAGFDDTAIVEITAVIAQNIFTNYFNHITDPVIDFPAVEMPG